MEAQNVILKIDRTKKDADVLEGKMCFCPYFVKNLAQCLCFETIKYRILILKFDLKKKSSYKLNSTLTESSYMHILSLNFIYLFFKFSETRLKSSFN